MLLFPTPLSCLFPLELSQGTDVCNNVEVEDDKPKDECKIEQMKNEMPEDVVEESDDQEVETDDGEVQSEDDCVETTPQMEDASVVKYSVKTTPYLQR